VCASINHSLARTKHLTLAVLAHERWTLSDPTFAMWQRIHRVFVEHGLPTPRVAVETGSPALRLPLVATSSLLGYSWASIVRKAVTHLPITELRVRELTLPFRNAVVYRKDGYLSPVARRFIEILKATAKEIASGK
ncbi:MAG: LysR substrate-binding domain-containing protein, partial [Vicinamibacterales bacterium]